MSDGEIIKKMKAVKNIEDLRKIIDKPFKSETLAALKIFEAEFIKKSELAKRGFYACFLCESKFMFRALFVPTKNFKEIFVPRLSLYFHFFSIIRNYKLGDSNRL